MPKFHDLKGQTIKAITGMEKGSEEVTLHLAGSLGITVTLYHLQNCCEHVQLEDINGDPNDLIGSEILLAEEVNDADGPEPKCPDSYTWTFYRLGTIKGTVVLRWLGESNGYYSENVDTRWSIVNG